MNESGNNKDELEDYLQQQAGKHRMYPSDVVWKNINRKIHTPKKWPALSIFTVLTISALVIGTVLNKPLPDTVTANFHFSLQSPANIAKPKNNNTNIAATQQQLNEEHYAVEQITKNTIIEAVEKTKIDNAVALQLMQNDNTAFAQINPANNISPALTVVTNADKSVLKNAQPQIAQTNSSHVTSPFNTDSYLFDISSRLKSILNEQPQPSQNRSGGVAFFLPRNNNNQYGDFEMNVKQTHVETIPLALEQLGKKSSRFDFRFYLTPSISYRRLNEKAQKSTQVNTISLSNYNIKPSQAIHQSAAIGYETGLGWVMHFQINLL